MASRKVSKFLSIRLSKPESDALTRIRGSRELHTNIRLSIKDAIHELIADGYAHHLEGLLPLPIQRSVPELESGGAYETYERIAYTKSDEDQVALTQMSICPDGEPVEYGDSDIIRELIRIFDVHNIHAPPKIPISQDPKTQDPKNVRSAVSAEA